MQRRRSRQVLVLEKLVSHVQAASESGLGVPLITRLGSQSKGDKRLFRGYSSHRQATERTCKLFKKQVQMGSLRDAVERDGSQFRGIGGECEYRFRSSRVSRAARQVYEQIRVLRRHTTLTINADLSFETPSTMEI
jgi:hypothetical protein